MEKSNRIEFRVSAADKAQMLQHSGAEAGQFSRWARALLLGVTPHPQPTGDPEQLVGYAAAALEAAIRQLRQQRNADAVEAELCDVLFRLERVDMSVRGD